MDLIAELATPPTKRRPVKSLMDVWLDEQTDQIRAAVLDAAKGQAWGHTNLRDKLAAAGAPHLSTNAIAAWRKNHGWIA